MRSPARLAVLLLLAGCGGASGFRGPFEGGATDDAAAGDAASPADGAAPVDLGGGGMDSGPDPLDRSRCTGSPDVRGVTQRMVEGPSGEVMKYVAYAPPSYDKAKPHQLVLALHGAGDRADNYFNVVWKSNADALDLIVLTPEGSCAAGPGFTWCRDDANSALAAIDDLEACYTVDAHRRIIHGFSAGGVMAYAIGLQASKLFAGMSISAADLGTAEAISGMRLLPAEWTIPLSQFHGTMDMNFPISVARQGRDRLLAAGHMVYWHEFAGGHTTSAAFAAMMIQDLAASRSP